VSGAGRSFSTWNHSPDAQALGVEPDWVYVDHGLSGTTRARSGSMDEMRDRLGHD